MVGWLAGYRTWAPARRSFFKLVGLAVSSALPSTFSGFYPGRFFLGSACGSLTGAECRNIHLPALAFGWRATCLFGT